MIPFFDHISKTEQRKPIVDVAEIISLVLDPFGNTLITSLIVISTLNISFNENKFRIIIFLLLALVIPVAYLAYGLWSGKIKDIFITDRRERYTLLVIVSGVAIIFNLILWFYGAPKLITAYSLAALALALILTGVTFFWKISGHSSVVTMNILTLILTLGTGYLWLILLIPVVAWSRVRLKVHTLEQVLVGALASASIFFIVFSYFQLIQLY